MRNPKTGAGMRFLGYVIALITPERFSCQSPKTTYGDLVGIEVRAKGKTVQRREFPVNGTVPVDEMRLFTAKAIADDLFGEDPHDHIVSKIELALNPDAPMVLRDEYHSEVYAAVLAQKELEREIDEVLAG